MIKSIDLYIEKTKEYILINKLKEANKSLNIALRIKKDSAKVNNLLGVIAEYNNDLIKAQKFYRVALIFDEQYIPAKKNLERCIEFEYSKNGIHLG